MFNCFFRIFHKIFLRFPSVVYWYCFVNIVNCVNNMRFWSNLQFDRVKFLHEIVVKTVVLLFRWPRPKKCAEERKNPVSDSQRRPRRSSNTARKKYKDGRNQLGNSPSLSRLKKVVINCGKRDFRVSICENR